MNWIETIMHPAPRKRVKRPRQKTSRYGGWSEQQLKPESDANQSRMPPDQAPAGASMPPTNAAASAVALNCDPDKGATTNADDGAADSMPANRESIITNLASHPCPDANRSGLEQA